MKGLDIEEIGEMLDYAYGLKFDDEPDYDYLQAAFTRMADRKVDDFVPFSFDWSENYEKLLQNRNALWNEDSGFA